jgi:hypothetical protein
MLSDKHKYLGYTSQVMHERFNTRSVTSDIFQQVNVEHNGRYVGSVYVSMSSRIDENFDKIYIVRSWYRRGGLDKYGGRQLGFKDLRKAYRAMSVVAGQQCALLVKGHFAVALASRLESVGIEV